MIRFLLVRSKRGIIVIEKGEFDRSHALGDMAPYRTCRAMTAEEAVEGMAALGLEYRRATVGKYTSEYYDVTEDQAVLVKMFMQ